MPKYSNEFLSIGVGARALAMSNLQSSIANDVTAGYWNPAGLVKLQQQYEGALMHASYFGGIANYDYAAFATQIDSGKNAIALSVIRFGIDNIPDTRFLFDTEGRVNYANVRSFSASDYGFLFSYASQTSFLKNLCWGVNFKVIHRNVGQFANAWGMGLDAAFQYTLQKWQFGVTARDITGTYNVWNYNPETFQDVFAATANQIPSNSTEITLPRLVADAAYSVVTKNFGFLAVAGFEMTFDGKRNTLVRSQLASIEPKTGIELDYKKIVFLRGGIGNFQRIKNFDNSLFWSYQPNFGVGFQFKNFTIDYALTNVGSIGQGLYSHIFSLKVSFTPKK
ncbi:MAG: hypothetical protein NZM38_01075 [Cytophagales bacterium]|nr:hypothetical protein [Cytophagales bacterium]MDW8383341.1 hypothetical protein [Flammeovirgaceae bacterium]